jgi:hypothetical protein
MNLFKKTPTIEFFTSEWSARKFYPIKPAKECLPPYWKEMPAVIPTRDYPVETAKKCPGITDWITSGYILSAWTDIEVIQDSPGGPRAILHNGRETNSAHPPSQCLNLLDHRSHHLGSIKLPDVWMVKTAPGWSIMVQPLWYWKNQPWEQMPGIMHMDFHSCEINMNMILKTTENFTIAAGTPLCQIIPFKRENVTGVSRAMRIEDAKRHNILNKLFSWTKNGFPKFYRRKINYSLDQQDLDLEESLKYPIERV